MKKRTVLITGLAMTLALTGTIYGASASSVVGETQMAGMSMMLQEYYYSQAVDNAADNSVAENPETIMQEDYDLINSEEEVIVPEEQHIVEVGGAEAPTDIQVDAAVSPQALGVEGQADEQAVEQQVPEEQPVPEQTSAPVEEVSPFANVGISIANQYVNIRKKPNTESKVLGKLYRGSAATIVKTKGDWVKIKSGSVEGYIKTEFLAIGKKAEKLVDKYGTKIATVTTTTLKVREETNTDCTVLTLVPLGEEFVVTKEKDEWVKIIVDETTKGFVSREFVDLSVEFEEAISIEEEMEIERQRKEAEEAAAQAAAEERARRAAAAAQAAANRTSSSNKSNSSSSSSKKTDTGKVYTGSGTGSDVAAYAQKFIGNPYSYGGTSLTNGTDCSGFVQSVYKKYGVSLPRTSGSQAGSGKKVSVDNVKPGDVVYYTSGGRVNHVAIYIGGGKVVHASDRRTGIKISNMRYRTPSGARRMVE